MIQRQRRKGRLTLGHDGRVVRAALLAGIPALALALVLLWTGDHSLKLQVTLTLIVVSVWVGFLISLHDQVVRPLQSIANLLAAVREGDFSIRGRRQDAGEVLGTALTEINLLGDTLREQRLGAVEASTLLAKVMYEIDVAIFAFDEDQQLRLINHAGEQLLARNSGRVVGLSATELGMTALLEGDGRRTLELTFAGARQSWDLRRTEFRQQGRPHQLVVLANVQRALRDEERQAWQRLVRVLGHEINNSLAPIQSIAAHLLQALQRQARRPDWEEDLARGLTVVERRAEGLGRFMKAYARLARLPPPTVAPIDVVDWLGRASALDARLAVVVKSGPPLFLRGDIDQLDQLLINLIRNAVDAALETAGAVSLTWARSEGFVEILIDDEGPGITDASNLFVPFFTTKPNGSGIGLILGRQIAEAHRGSLDLRNRQDRSGCQAVVRLPL
ncbi:MAG: two-component system, NtrC family, nitrogen regulation sensor histidine kinase NtrY [Myxococcales bacterium]|jgi:nitrogen fixation/metabolism regulation signal transduction histidine kinase|nr:two-component system, NtrC family, nitrogen regulation sensor histidine kinase NtrY [Myxococcales bacterium]